MIILIIIIILIMIIIISASLPLPSVYAPEGLIIVLNKSQCPKEAVVFKQFDFRKNHAIEASARSSSASPSSASGAAYGRGRGDQGSPLLQGLRLGRCCGAIHGGAVAAGLEVPHEVMGVRGQSSDCVRA